MAMLKTKAMNSAILISGRVRVHLGQLAGVPAMDARRASMTDALTGRDDMHSQQGQHRDGLQDACGHDQPGGQDDAGRGCQAVEVAGLQLACSGAGGCVP